MIERTEVPGTYADGTPYTLLAPTYSIDDLGYGPLAADIVVSPRIAPAVFGVGLLEAVPDDALLDARRSRRRRRRRDLGTR